MVGKDLVERITQGHEVVVISHDEMCNSAVFYKGLDGVYAWSREIGNYKHNDLERLAAHFDKMAAEYAYIFVRGVGRAAK